LPRQPADGPPRIVTIAPRTSKPFEWQSFTLSSGERAVVATGGVILMVRNTQNMEVVDIEADRLVFWSQGDTEHFFSNMRSSHGQTTKELEFYLAGNVELRRQSRPTDNKTMRADELYYDVGRNVAVGVTADLELHQPNVPDPIHVKADEILQLSPSLWEAARAEVYCSRLPSDPGLKVYFARVTVEERREAGVRRRPVNSQNGNGAALEPVHYFNGTNVFLELEGVPFFYLPFLQGDAERPFGPLVDASFGYNKIFGAEISFTFDMYDLLGIAPIQGTRWRLDIDELTKRGPALGQHFDYHGKDLFGIPSQYTGLIRAFGIYDNGEDILGGDRIGQHHTHWRGQFLWRQDWWKLPYGFTVQAQVNALSDQNFLEQYHKNEFDNDFYEQTYLYVKQQQDIWAWTFLVEPRLRSWVTETEWLPRGDGHLLGVSFLDLFTYNAGASAGYAQLRPAQLPSPPPVESTQTRINTGRLDLWQELSLPFYIGPVRFVPYGVVDLTYYSQDLAGNDIGRFYGAGGVRASIPFTRLYPDVQSELWNLNGINHKIVVSTNYYIAHSDVRFTQLPQLDMLDDDPTDQARRDITPQQPLLNPAHGLALEFSPLYNVQTFALRQLVNTSVDTLDSMQVLEMDIRQRLQTKRGFPGMQHIVDWMTLDVSASYYPDANRDNFGHSFAFLQYDYVWNIGDRTALTSSGWLDPFPGGASEWTVGAFLNRTDRTSFFLGYRQIDLLQSKAVTGSATYVFSPKYAVTGSTVYDFGTSQALANSLVLTRMGSDLQISVGITYNVLQNNFGATFMIIPNLLPSSRNPAAMSGAGVLGR
jgi:hypothetical protein